MAKIHRNLLIGLIPLYILTHCKSTSMCDENILVPKILQYIIDIVNRFYLGARFDILSLSNLYSNRLEKTWQVPPGYSLYESASKEERMKNSYAMLVLSFRLTKK
jgi:hypothetical protein